LEPVQIAGFNQAFRSVAPESAVGLVPGTRFTTYGVGLDHSFRANTYLSVAGEILKSDAERSVGTLNTGGALVESPGQTRQTLQYTEKSLVISLNQLVSTEWSLGGRYQLTHADLTGRF